MIKQLKKYNPDIELAEKFQIQVRDYVTGECRNIDFDNLVLEGIIVPYIPDGKKAFRVFV